MAQNHYLEFSSSITALAPQTHLHALKPHLLPSPDPPQLLSPILSQPMRLLHVHPCCLRAPEPSCPVTGTVVGVSLLRPRVMAQALLLPLFSDRRRTEATRMSYFGEHFWVRPAVSSVLFFALISVEAHKGIEGLLWSRGDQSDRRVKPWVALTLSKEQIIALRARPGAACVSEHHAVLQYKAGCAGTHLGSQTEGG